MIILAAYSVTERKTGTVENIVAIFQLGRKQFCAAAFAGTRDPMAWEWSKIPQAEAASISESITRLTGYVAEYAPDYELVPRAIPHWTPAEC